MKLFTMALCLICVTFPAVAAEALETFSVRAVGRDIPVYFHRPATAPSDAPVVIVMHGVGRDADRYLLEWRGLADAYGFAVLVPEFSQSKFPGAANYNMGRLVTSGGKLRPRDEWSYSAIEVIFDAARRELELSADGYILYGHSAGAQFVHRFMMLGVGPRATLGISANAGWYTFPGDAAWPYGWGGVVSDEFDMEVALAAPMVVLLGDADTDPNDDSLRRTPEAMAQGPHRFARGLTFFVAGRSIAAERALPFSWSCIRAVGLGHENGVAAQHAVPIIIGQTLPEPGKCLTSAFASQ